MIVTNTRMAENSKFILDNLNNQAPENFATFAMMVMENRVITTVIQQQVGSISGLHGPTDANTKKEIATEISHNYHFLARWASYGFNVFELTHSLAAGLMLTEPEPYNPDSFKLPFPALVVRVPQRVIPLWVNENKQVWATSVWVHIYRHAANENSPAEPWIHIVIRTDSEVDYWRQRPLQELYSSDRQWERPELLPSGVEFVSEDETTYLSTVRLIRNLVSWLAFTGGTATRSTQSRPAKKNADKIRPSVWVLGQEVKLSKELREAALDSILGARGAREGWKLNVRYIVRGHWRNQAHGPSKSLRRRQWIEPFWKGPEDGEKWSHLYRPEGVEEQP